MVSIARWTLGIRACMEKWTSASKPNRYVHLSPVALFALTSPFDPTSFAGPDPFSQDSRSVATRLKWDQLMDSLSRDRSNPSRVWTAYLELGSVMGFASVPMPVQQQVLRRSVPRTDSLRYSAARRMKAGNRPSTPHIYETRLQTVISHIRESGRKPDIEDYNFILEQFAAVGHQAGALMVFHELARVEGLQPTFRTYGLCFQTIAHRLTLPCPFRFRRHMYTQASRMCTELLDDMWSRRIPLTSVNFDLVHRIFKDTSDQATFDKLLKVGYGIDLAYPDRPPLEVQGPALFTTDAKDLVEFNAFKPLPFSTAALNTLIDALGQRKQISKMVMAYEVLTTPHPTLISNPSATQWSDEEDEDDDPALFQFPPPGGDATPYEYPHATPNTTTFKLLIRYASKAKHAVFTRHYVVQAMERDRQADAQLRADLSSKPLAEITSPNLAVNRGTFLPPFGLANRTKHFGFLRWCYGQTNHAWKQKQHDLAFYTQWRQQRVVIPMSRADSEDDAENAPTSVQSDWPDLRANANDLTPLSASEPSAPNTSSASIVELPEVLKIDLDAPPPPPTERKRVDLDRHISLLKRDVEEMGELVQRMTDAVERLSQRVKERLGRRIWQGKDIYFMSLNKRIRVGRKAWTEQVGYHVPRRNPNRPHPAPDLLRKEQPPHSDALPK